LHTKKRTPKQIISSFILGLACKQRREESDLQLGDLGDEVEGLALRLEGDVVPGGDLLAVLLLVLEGVGIGGLGRF